MASLKQELDAIRLSSEGDGTKPGRIPPDLLQVMHGVTHEQQQSNFRQRMPAADTPAPLFSLPNQDGTIVRSGELLAQGPLVVSFFRGQW